jgi:hypothetical protein
VKKELENQQNLERIKVEKTFLRPGTANLSRSQNLSQSKVSYQSSSKIGKTVGGGAPAAKHYPASKPSNQ